MALVNTETISSQFQGLSRLPMLRQIGLIVGLAASIAFGVAVVLWSQEPNYSLLYAGISNADKGQVLEALDNSRISYRMDPGSGAVMVASNQVHEARLKLATLGLPKSDVIGMEFLEKDQALGTSRLIETARYHRALGGELSRSIATLDSVESARVHLAIPKRSVFVRNRSEPTASVLVNLYPGRDLGDSQIAGIVHLVASSIPDLEAEQVTVVDQKGRLLTTNHVAGDITLRTAHFNYTQRLEESYANRIVDILTPIVGADGVRAQVSADVDFTSVEKTSETYNPETTSVRSEQVEEQNTTESNPAGVPGALSNQPPERGSFEEQGDEGEPGSPMSTRRSSTRNFEIDRTLSRTKTLPGSVNRLSVAVVIDYRLQAGKKGKVERVPMQPEEMDYIKALVKEAIGFDDQRGDSVNVINASFKEVVDVEPVDAMPLWREPWLFDILKQFVGVLLVLFLLFGVLRPVLRSLAEKGSAPEVLALPAEEAQGELPMGEDRLSLTNQQGVSQQGRPLNPEQKMEMRLNQARSFVNDDPKRGAQVVKTWLTEEEQ